MNLIILLIVGGLIGWVASMLVGGGGGIVMNVIVGIVGALIAGFLLNPYIGGGNIMSGDLSLSAIAVSLLGSVLLLLVVNMVAAAGSDLRPHSRPRFSGFALSAATASPRAKSARPPK